MNVCGPAFEWQGKIINSCNMEFRLRNQSFGEAVALVSIFLIMFGFISVISLMTLIRSIKSKSYKKLIISLLVLVVSIWLFASLARTLS